MKKLFYAMFFIAVAHFAHAQNTFPSSGNVGIGTTTPAHNFDVFSAATTTVRIGTTATTGKSDLNFQGSTNSWKISKAPSNSSSPSESGVLGFTCNNGSGVDQRVMEMRLNGGYAPMVIIGTGTYATLGSQPLLAVDGRTSCRLFIVTEANPFPDYVFNKNYKMQSLHELDAYITSHQRLPGMPTADEVEKTGLDVAPLTNTLVEKVEELTLHLIEMSNKISALQKKNSDLKRRITLDNK